MSYGRQMGYGPPLGAVIPKSTYDAVLAPTVNEDSGDGYSVGSRLIDIVLEHEHVLVNPAAGAAVWKPTTYTTSAGMPDPYVPPDGDWDVTGSISATVDVSAASFTGGTYTGTLIDLTQTKLNAASTPPEMVTFTGAAHGDSTPIAATVEATDVLVDLGRTVTWADGTIASQAAFKILAPTYDFATAGTVSKGYTVYIDGAPTAGGNCTMAAGDAFALYCGGHIGVPQGTAFYLDADQANPVNYIDQDTLNITRFVSANAATAEISAGGSRVGITSEYAMWIKERSAKVAGVAGYGELYVKDDAPTILHYVDDADTDFRIVTDTHIQTKLNAASTPPEMLTLIGAAHGDATPIAASVMATDVLWDFDRTITYATGALAEHSAVIIKAPELAFAGASTVAKAYTVKIEGPPTQGANCTLAAEDSFALYSGGHIGVASGKWFCFDANQATPNDYIYANSSGVIDIHGSAVRLARFSISSASQILPPTGFGLEINQTIRAGSVPAEILTVTGAAHTTMTASTEATSMLFDFGQTMQWATGALASNATIKINPPTLAFVGASVVTRASTVQITNAPQPGASCTITNPYALEITAGNALIAGGKLDLSIAGDLGEYWISNGDNQMNLYVGGAKKLTVESTIPVAIWYAMNMNIQDNAYFAFGSTYTTDSALSWQTAQTPTHLCLGLSAASRALIICERADWGVDFAHALPVDPTIFWQASDATDITKWGSAAHDGSDFVFATGKGEFHVKPVTGSGLTLTQTAAETTTPGELLTLTGATIGGVTPITASTEYTDAVLNFSHTVTFATGALGSQRACRIEGPTYAFAGASVITNCATLYLTAPIAGANATITNRWALWTESGNIRSDGNIYTVEAASADPHIAAYGQWWVLNSAPCMPMFDDDTGTERSIITGLGTSGAAIRAGTITVTGTGDNTTCTAEMFDDWNSEALAVETIDSDFPTGGTRFDLSADKFTITAKGITNVALISLSHHIHSSDVGVDWNVHVGIAGGKLTITANVATTGAAVDFAAAALNGKIIDFNFTYLTSD